MRNDRDREQIEEFKDIFTRLYSNTMKELAEYARNEKEQAIGEHDEKDWNEIRRVMDNITHLYEKAISELNTNKSAKTEENLVTRTEIPRNPNKKPTKINVDRSMARIKEENRRAIEDILGRY